MNIKKYLATAIGGVAMLSLLAIPALADSLSVNFEPGTYTTGNINGQDGWMKTGPYDVAVVSNGYGFTSFDSQSLRISNAVTTGAFGDQTFAKPLADSVGEIDSTEGTYSIGTMQTHFEMQFDIASTMQTQQLGLAMSVSPDRGDGSRMSYLRFEDGTAGIDVFFDDVQGTTNPANFVETPIATGLDRTDTHTIKLTLDTLDGPSNDIVKVWIDGDLKITGTSWENYYRYDTEASAEQSPRIVKTVIFRTAGTAVPANLNNGFLFDNFSTAALTPVMPSVPTFITPTNGAVVTTSALVKVDWTDSTGTFSPFEYQYQAFSDAGYSIPVYTSGWLTNSEIPTPGTPPGDYYIRVRARDSEDNESSWSNNSLNAYKVTVVADPILIGPPTDKDQCKKGGWESFNNPAFKNQGSCVSYVVSNENAGKQD